MPPREPVRHVWIWGMALGYFAWYIPYSALTKALSQGLLPGMKRPVPGFVLLPATALATTATLLLFLAVGARGALADPRGLLRRRPRHEVVVPGVATAVIIATTTLNYTFTGISILMALLLMRGGVLILAPIVDLTRGRRVRAASWAALALSLLALAVAFADVRSYRMTLAAGLNVAAYLAGYAVRLNAMSRLSKSGDPAVDRRYFFEEAAVAAVALTAIPALLAMAGQGEVLGQLRYGFTGFFRTELVWPALLIGALYGCLYMFGTSIYNDARENSFCIPLNRCASLLSGLVASYALTAFFGWKAPGPAQLAATGIVVAALALLMASTVAAYRRAPLRAAARVFLFVCGGNTSRSPMAQAICNAEIARRLGVAISGLEGAPARALSAGLTAEAGRPLSGAAAAALRHLGVAPHEHASRPVTPELVAQSEWVFCMTESQRLELVGRFPDAESKIQRLDPGGDIDDPVGRDEDAFRALGERLQDLVRLHLPITAV